jgi:ceramide glucosyltransferase
MAEIGGFASLADCLADDYQLGNRLALRGHRIELASAVVDCCAPQMAWGGVWRHQLRWARTIRVSKPAPYFFSILSNATLWPLLWMICFPSRTSLATAAVCVLTRIAVGYHLQAKLNRTSDLLLLFSNVLFVPLKDLLQAALWIGAFLGTRIEWRGETYRLRRDGTLLKVA